MSEENPEVHGEIPADIDPPIDETIKIKVDGLDTDDISPDILAQLKAQKEEIEALKAENIQAKEQAKKDVILTELAVTGIDITKYQDFTVEQLEAQKVILEDTNRFQPLTKKEEPKPRGIGHLNSKTREWE